MLWILGCFRKRPVVRARITPEVSLIIAAYNEEQRIQKKLENTLALDYPKEKLQIIVASDASSDATDRIVREHSDQGIELVRAPERHGKEYAQKLALDNARGEIVIFSDMATVLESNAIEEMVMNFADPTVGCVSSEDRILSDGSSSSGEGLYIRYEMFLRKLESRVNTVVGLSGSFFAARNSICKEWDVDLPSDFNTLINAVRNGYRGISDPETIGYYKNVESNRMEFRRKVRTVLRGITLFMRKSVSINPLKHPLFYIQMLSHKLCRWLVPFCLIIMLLANIVLAAESPFFRLVLTLQLAFYFIGLIGFLSATLRRRIWVRIPCFFMTVNASILVAWTKYLLGIRQPTWKPSAR